MLLNFVVAALSLSLSLSLAISYIITQCLEDVLCACGNYSEEIRIRVELEVCENGPARCLVAVAPASPPCRGSAGRALWMARGGAA